MAEVTKGEGSHGRRFWRTRRNRIASTLVALLLALALGFFVLGRGPGTLIWLSGSRLSWLPFVGAGLNWLPVRADWLTLGAQAAGTGGRSDRSPTAAIPPSGGRPGQPSPATSGSAGAPPTAALAANATPAPGSSTRPTAQPGTGPPPSPSADPTALLNTTPIGSAVPPLSTPTPILSGIPTLGLTPTPTPTATPTPTPTPTPTLTPAPTPAPTPTPFQPVLLFSDNFSADLPLLAPSGWTNEPAVLLGLGGYTVASDGGNVLRGPAGSTGFPAAVAGSSAWTDYNVAVDMKVSPTSGSARVLARHQSAGNYYACGLDANQQLILGREVGGTWSTLAANGYSFNATTWYHVELSVQGNTLGCIVTEPGSGHSRQLTATAANFAGGAIGASGEYGAEYDNFVVTSLP